MPKVKVIQACSVLREVEIEIPEEFLVDGWSDEAQLKVDLSMEENWNYTYFNVYDQEIEKIAP